MSDRKQFDNSVLVDPETGELRDIRWTRHNGNIAWEYEGEIYTKQHTPPMLHNLECSAEVMLAEMDYAGVDMGVLHTYPTMGHPTHLNAYLRDITTRFPERFRRTVYLREASIPNDPEEPQSRPWTGSWRREGLSGTSSSRLLLQPERRC